MPDFAELGFKIDKTPVDQAATSLDKLTAAAGRTEAASKRLVSGMSAAGASARAIGESQRSWEQGLARLAIQQQTLIGHTNRAHQSFGRFQNAIANLGLSAVGVQGPMQKVIETIAILGIGTAWVTGILAGLAAIALAFNKLTEQTRKAQKAYDDYMESLRKNTPLAIVGAQLDEARAKLQDMQDRYQRLGQAGARASDLLKQAQEVERLRLQYEALFTTMHDAALKAGAAGAEIPKAPIIDWAEGVAAALADIDFAIKDVLLNGERLGRNLGAVLDPTLVRGTGNVLANPGPETVEQSAKIATNWQSVASSVANTVTLLANADDATSRWLGNMVNLVGLIADANQELREIGKLSTGSIVGLIGGGLGLLAGLFGEDAGSRRSREIAEENVRALERNSRALDNVTAGITGNAFTTARGGVTALLGAGPAGLGMGPRGSTTILNTAAVSAILAGQGTSLSELREFAKSLGITLDTTSTRTFIESLEKLNEQMQQMALVTLKSFGSQLDLINRQWALGNVTDPMAKIADLLKLITGEQGSPGLATLGNFDLSSGGGRNAALTFLQNQLLKAQNGGLTTAELGGLTVQQYLDFIGQFGALLNEANQALQATIDNLQSFADSLKLDQSLTTLSPAQQLAEARRQYEDVLRAAQAGDLNAANRLPDVARQFLSASRAYNASSPAYAADFARVLADTEAVQKLLQGQEDGWRAVEKPLVNVVDNTAKMYQEQQTTNEVLRVGLLELGAKLDMVVTTQQEQIRVNKIGFEGGKV